MTGLILRVILILIVVRILYKFGRALLEGAGLIAAPPKESAVGLVRDPVCGVFVAPAQALTSRSAGTTAYFCSEKCRKAWDER
jgi:YHS domain-containing protein